MSLLIIVYLAIVLILVLVTMLLLRWHKVLRTPLDVLSDSRVHQSPPMVMEDRELAAAAASNSVTPATVSIMVMYRPHKPRGITQPSTVELPPSYESLFMGDSPPSYNIAANDDEEADAADFEAANQNASILIEEECHNPTSVQNSRSSIANVASAASAASNSEDDDHCECDCDHSRCMNASNEVLESGQENVK